MLSHLKKGFTIMELMIVIAIIGVLAAALFPRLSDYQARGRDTKRWVDVRAIQVALEMKYNDAGAYPQSNLYSGNQEPNSSWSNSSHSGSWKSLSNQLQGYITPLPVDPNNVQTFNGSGGWNNVFVYSYFSVSTYCGGKPAYALTYSLEKANPVDVKNPITYCPGFTDYRHGPDNKWLITIGNTH